MKTYELKIDGKDYKVDIERFDGKRAAVKVNGTPYEIDVASAVRSYFPGGVTPPPSFGIQSPPQQRTFQTVQAPTAPQAPQTFQAPQAAHVPQAPQATPQAPQPQVAVPAGGQVVAPIPGLITEVLVSVGQKVSMGDTIIKMDAMKMENEIFAPVGGTVKDILVKKGDRVQTDDILAVIDAG